MSKVIPVQGTRSGAIAIADRIIANLDEKYYLCEIDYRDEMPDSVLEAYVKHGRDKALDVFDEDDMWLLDAEVDSCHRIIDELTTAQERDELQEFDEHYRVQDAIYERNASTPFDDLLRNTGEKWLVYDLGMDVDQPEYVTVPSERFGTVSQATPEIPKKIAEHLGLDYEAEKDNLRELVENAGYGGSLQLLFRETVDEFDGLENGREYQLEHVNLAIIDYMNGSGHDVTIKTPFTITWDRSKLSMNSYYAQDVCGLAPSGYSGTTIKLAEGK